MTNHAVQILSSVIFALTAVPLIQWARNTAALPWVNERTVFWVSGAVAALGQVGIHFSYNATVGSFTVTGLTAGVLSKWAMQHIGYKHLRALDAIVRVADSLDKQRPAQEAARQDSPFLAIPKAIETHA